MKKFLPGLMALLVAFTLFAFTSPKSSSERKRTNYVWFMVNTSGVIQNPSTGVLGAEPPGGYGCNLPAIDLCAYGYDLGDVTDIGGGFYEINEPSETFDPEEHFDAVRRKDSN